MPLRPSQPKIGVAFGNVWVFAVSDFLCGNPGVTVTGVAAALGFGPDIARVGMVQLEAAGLLERGERCKTGAEWRAVENNPPPAK